MSVNAYPLQWPDGWARTRRPESAQFQASFAKARDGLMDELRKMGARLPVLSTNIALRRDGLPYANQPPPDDKGVAVYFEYRGNPKTFACDRWDRVEHNVQAIRKTIEALRGIERWGASDTMERAFTGFAALPGNDWRSVLGVPQDCADLETCRDAYKRRARLTHPGKGGDTESFQRVNQAWREAIRKLRRA